MYGVPTVITSPLEQLATWLGQGGIVYYYSVAFLFVYIVGVLGQRRTMYTYSYHIFPLSN